MDKSLLKQAPVTLCQLLSPYTCQEKVAALLIQLVTDQPLLEKTIECANRHFVVTNLYAQLQQHGLLAHLPTDLLDYLQTLHALQTERNQRLAQQARFIVRLFNEAGLTPLLMKGGDTLFYALYPSAGARFMSDLDILMPPDTVPIGQQLLAQHGYAIPEKYQHIHQGIDPHHALPLYKSGDDCAIELHYKPLNRNSGNLLATFEAFQNSQPITRLAQENLQALSLSPEHKILHCFVHSEISHGNQTTDTLDIRQMDYFARLVHYYGDSVDWRVIHSALAEAGLTQSWAIYCYKTQQLFSLPTTLSTLELSKQVYWKHYQSALDSAMSHYYPLRRIKFGLQHLFGVFSRERLSGLFTINNSRDHAKAIIQRLQQLIQQYALSPLSLLKRLRGIMTSAR